MLTIEEGLEFKEKVKVYLKISPMKGEVRFGKNGKLCPRYVCPDEILQWIGKVAYLLRLPSELGLVHSVFDVSMVKSVLVIPCP